MRVYLALVLGMALVACGFNPSGGTGDPDGDVNDPDGPAIDAAVTDGALPIDAAVPTDGRVDAMQPPVAGLVISAPMSDSGALDGNGNEFAASTRYPLDLAMPGHRDFDQGYQPSMRAELRAAHNATHLYLIVDVVEAGGHSGDSSDTWQNDAVTFFFDTNDDRSGAYGGDDHEIIIDFRPMFGIFPTTNGADPMLEAVRLDTAAGFTVEARIVRTSLGQLPGTGRYGFGWGIYDDDGGGNAEAFGLWYERPATRCAACCAGENHAEPWCDTTMLGQIAFSN